MSHPLKLLDLPNELILLAAENLNPKDLSSFLLANRFLCDLLTPHLHTLAAEDKDGQPTVHWAIENGHPTLALLVLGIKGASSNLEFQCPNECPRCEGIGGTAFHQAVRGRHTPVIRKLAEAGADIDARNSIDQTALCWAASKGDEELVKLLLELGVDIRSALGWAVKRGHESVVRLLLEKDKTIIELGGTEYRTPLHEAVIRGFEGVVRILLDNGGDVSAADGEGMTSLHHAVDRNHVEVVKLLLENGADCHSLDNNFLMSIHYAAIMDISGETTRILVANGADVNARNPHSGKTALHYAARNGRWEVVGVLLANGADINAKDFGGRTALLNAALSKNPGIASMLVAGGAEMPSGYQLSKEITEFLDNHCRAQDIIEIGTALLALFTLDS